MMQVLKQNLKACKAFPNSFIALENFCLILYKNDEIPDILSGQISYLVTNIFGSRGFIHIFDQNGSKIPLLVSCSSLSRVRIV